MRTYLFFILSSLTYGVNDFTVSPSEGMPVTIIDGVEAIDVRTIMPGDLLSYDVKFEHINFTFSGAEFLVLYDAFLTGISTDDNDWAKGQGAVFVFSPIQNTHTPIIQFPIGPNGITNSSKVRNSDFRTGFLFENPDDYWIGTPGNLHPGGLLGKIYIQYNPNHGSYCSSRLEDFQIFISPSGLSPNSDYFSDAKGERVAIIASSISDIHGRGFGYPGYYGDPSKQLRADADQDGHRSPADLSLVANCVLFGQSCSECEGWGTKPSDEFKQVFDFNCDGHVDPADLLGCATLVLGLRLPNTPLKQRQQTLNKFGFKQDGSIALFGELQVPNSGIRMNLSLLRGWRLIHKNNAAHITFLLLKKQEDASAIPNLTSLFATTDVNLVKRIKVIKLVYFNNDRFRSSESFDYLGISQ